MNVLVNLIAVNQMDPYDSDSSGGGSEFPSQSTNPEPPPFNDPNYETYKRGQQFMIVDHTANQRNGSEVSKIWQHGGERKEAYYPGEKPFGGGRYRGLPMSEGVVEKQPDRAAVWTFQEAEAVGGSEVISFNSRVNGYGQRASTAGPKFVHYAVKHIHFLLHHTSGCTLLMRK